jgi:C4-dicarboxylate-specific signal transduction histidine kinase
LAAATKASALDSWKALIRIARLGRRVVDIIGRIRALIQKTPPRQDRFDINETIREVISFTQEELTRNVVSVHSGFAQGLPLLRADRVQLQQVIVNLIMNAVEAMSSRPGGPREL